MKRVLLVDDDDAFTSRLVSELPQFDITLVRHAAAAVLVLRERAFDCLVVALGIGRFYEGVQVLDTRRARHLTMPAIALCSETEAEIFWSIQELDAMPLPKLGLTSKLLERAIRQIPVSAWPTREGIVRAIRRHRFTFDQTHDLAIDLLRLVVAEVGSVSGAARELDMYRQTAQDVLKRQVPQRAEHVRRVR